MNKQRLRGFTLVELMIVVAIIGVLAALAIYGTKRYLGSAKTAEARQTIGSIARAAQAAFERENAMAEDLAEGTESTSAAHVLCGSAKPVPATIPGGRKYQPKTTPGDDFDNADTQMGWKCLKFAMTQPHYYQYWYQKDAAVALSTNPASCNAPPCYEAVAFGDLNANGVPSQFSQTGKVANGELKKATQLYIADEYE